MTLTGEKADIARMFADQRTNYLYTVDGITDEQARLRTTVSELTLGGLLNHVINNERSWMKVIAEMDETAEFDVSRMGTEYVMAAGDYVRSTPASRRPPRPLSLTWTSTPRSHSRRHRGHLFARTSRCGSRCCTFSARWPSMQVTPTSSGSPSTAATRRGRWRSPPE